MENNIIFIAACIIAAPLWLFAFAGIGILFQLRAQTKHIKSMTGQG